MRINIFYSEVDNPPLRQMDSTRWIDGFVRFLKIMVGQLSGRKTEVYKMDFDTQGDQGDKIDLLFVSKASLKNHIWKTQVEQYIGQDLGRSSADNLYLIVKDPVHDISMSHISSLQHVYEFCKADGLPYENFFNKMEEGDFWFKLGDLAYDLYSKISNEVRNKKTSGGIGQRKVFIAECDARLIEQKISIKRELEYLGLNIYPKAHSLDTGIKRKEIITDSIDISDISIHLIGSLTEDKNQQGKTFEEVQIDLALQRHMKQKLINPEAESSVFVWMDPKHKKQAGKTGLQRKTLVTKLESHEDIKSFHGPFEDFIAYVVKKVMPMPHEDLMTNASFIKNADPISVYFIYDKRDELEAAEMISKMRRRGFTVFNSVFNIDILAVRHAHMEFLRRFDVAVLFSLRTSVEWMDAKISDILKAPGLPRHNSISSKCIITHAEMYEQLSPARFNFDYLPYSPRQTTIDLDLYFNNLLEQGIIHS